MIFYCTSYNATVSKSFIFLIPKKVLSLLLALSSLLSLTWEFSFLRPSCARRVEAGKRMWTKKFRGQVWISQQQQQHAINFNVKTSSWEKSLLVDTSFTSYLTWVALLSGVEVTTCMDTWNVTCKGALKSFQRLTSLSPGVGFSVLVVRSTVLETQHSNRFTTELDFSSHTRANWVKVTSA